jgi:hypothetical protein
MVKKSDEIKKLYKNLKSSKYLENSFGEFICWYAHIVYAWAIDFLVEKKVLIMPKEKFGSLIIYTKEPQGLLTIK